MRMVLQYWAGDERGSLIPEELNDFPITIPVGTQIPIAVGAAWAAKLKGDKIAVMAYMGDGATSKGDLHEGLPASWLRFVLVLQPPWVGNLTARQPNG